MGVIRYSGHPFVDVGVAVIENYLNLPVEEIDFPQLEKACAWLQETYERKDVKGYLTVNFPNSGWCNPTISEEKKKVYINKILYGFRSQDLIPGRKCAFCDNSAQVLADRQHIPLLTGASVIITAPSGVLGLPVCGFCLCAIQFYPLGTLKVNGRPLFWWTPEPEWTRRLVGNYFQRIQKLLIGTSADDKFPNLSWPWTRLIESAREVFEDYDEINGRLTDCLGYHVTNYGSAPDYQQYYLPQALVEFWRSVRTQAREIREAHAWVEERSWEAPKQKKGKEQEEQEFVVQGLRKNAYYEALGQVLEKGNQEGDWERESQMIVPRFFLRLGKDEYEKNCFALCDLYLREVCKMEAKRLETIKAIADRITEKLIIKNNERKWLMKLYKENLKTKEFLDFLVRAQKRLSELGDPFSLDDVLLMLGLSSQEDVTFQSQDVWLVQSLFLIRMLELVCKHQREVLEELDKNEQNAEA